MSRQGRNQSKAAQDHRSNQLNPNNPAYHSSRQDEDDYQSQAAQDNRSNQLNPNNPAYHSSRE